MSYRISGLDPAPFRPLFEVSDDALRQIGARSMTADRTNSFPDRISLTDAAIGDRMLLVNYVFQPANTPYRGAHAIYLNEASEQPFDAIDVVPQALRGRLLSLRAYDADHMMIDADIIDGSSVEALIDRLLANDATAYVHAHFAKRGCYAARIDRV